MSKQAEAKQDDDSLAEAKKLVITLKAEPGGIASKNFYKEFSQLTQELSPKQTDEILWECFDENEVYNFIASVISHRKHCDSYLERRGVNQLLNKIITDKVVGLHDVYDWTLLHWAVSEHNTAIVEKLLESNASPQAKNRDGDDCVKLAAQWQDVNPHIYKLVGQDLIVHDHEPTEGGGSDGGH